MSKDFSVSKGIWYHYMVNVSTHQQSDVPVS